MRDLLLWLCVTVAGVASGEEVEPSPFRVSETLALPWLRFGLEHRTRLEHLAYDYRPAHDGDASGVSLRTLLSAELRLMPVVVGAELQDARGWFTPGTPLSTAHVNPLEPLQAYVGLRLASLALPGDSFAVTAGRLTLDVGSRRLVARNEFRNTINGFTGLDAQWSSPSGDVVQAFVAVPVVRRPTGATDLAASRVELDLESPDALVWGLFAQSRPLTGGVRLDASVFGVHERDGAVAASSNRDLLTHSLRASRAPRGGAVDFELELMGQLGTSHATARAEDVTALRHVALGAHAEVGHRFRLPWAPRAVLQYDFASGDADPTDGVNGRFDPLFGARRFDLSPSGLWGALARSNVNTPGVRVEAQPHRRVDAFVSWRLVWLAAARDAWTVTELRDVTGGAGSFLGQQGEARVRWHVFPRNLTVEVGGALLVQGRFLLSTAAHARPSVWGYSQLTGSL